METKEKAVEVLEKIQSVAKNCKAEDRLVKNWIPGQFVRQGDVYLTCVPSDWPHGKELENHQLVPGNSKGSRHIAGESIRVYEGKQVPEGIAKRLQDAHKVSGEGLARVILGPLLEIKERSSVTHPEHGDYSLPGGCHVQVTYQLNSRDLQRAQD
jgi:hypothetical protein